MMRIGRRIGWWVPAFVLVLLTGFLQASGVLRPQDRALADAGAHLLQRVVSSNIVIVGIDDDSVDALGSRPMPRRYHAKLLEELGRAQPAGVFLDINLGTASGSPEDDDLLEAALAKRREFPLYLPVIVTPAVDGRSAPLAIRPLPRFARSADLVAVDATSPEASRTREWWTFRILDGERTASVIDPGRSFAEPRAVPIDFTISPESFELVSFADVLAGRVPQATFSGKRVFVGATLASSAELLDVPVHGRLPRIVVQALAAETVNAGVPQSLPIWGTILVLAALTLLAAVLLRPAWRRNLAVLSLLVAVLLSISGWAWISQRTVMPLAGSILLIVLLAVLSSMRWVERRLGRSLAVTLNLRRQDGLLKGLVQSSTDSILCVDDEGIVRLANPAAARLFGCAAYDLLDEPIARFITLLAGDGAGARLAALHGEIRECDARTLAGEVFPVEISVSRVRVDGTRLYTTIVRDIRERRAQHRRLVHEATHDSLTSLPNRAALLAHLERALAPDRSQPTIALLMLDLCRFKEVNDTLGHNVGDRVLCEVAQRFRQALGDRGFIARIGGDEFTVVVNRPHSSESVASTSQALVDCLRSPIDVAGISIEVGVSIGIARFPQDASEAQTLLRHADVAMYVAKRRGAPYEFYDSAQDENSVRKLAIGGELRSAIAGDQLQLHFQPQVNLRSGMVDSVEALVRWFHPTQGAIAPAEFIAIAESTDLIRHLTEWSLRTALAQVRAWRSRGVHVRIAVNISSRQLQDTGFPVQLASLLRESAVAAASLELEITEGAMMLDPARALRVIQEIHALGVLISIDDFGTGYSSLSYLRDLPVHALKLDRSFVAGMSSNADDRIIVESTAQMAHAMRLALVAEGVETEWDAQFLSAAGYDYAQGFRYTGALPAEQCLAWIAEFNATAIVAAGDTTITTALRAQAAHREIQLREPLKRAR